MQLWRKSLDLIDRLDARWRQPEHDGNWRRVAMIVTLCALCLFGIHYLRFTSVLHHLIACFLGPAALADFQAHPWSELFGQLWWGGVHLVGYVLIPLLAIGYGWRQPLRDFGLGWAQTGPWLIGCLALAAPIIFFAFIASHTQSFQHTYPFYRLAGRSWMDLLLWELIYLSQFVFLEFFFRGFLLHALAPRFGVAAIFIMCLPYLMIHFVKPWPEAFGALPFGILLGMIALGSRSIWGGALVHMSIALSMDLMSLWQTQRWPGQWFPG
ncbi:MAG: CPBP family intramembrane glutamic endopeptidase [Panacagrimonas sp.]